MAQASWYIPEHTSSLPIYTWYVHVYLVGGSANYCNVICVELKEQVMHDFIETVLVKVRGGKK